MSRVQNQSMERYRISVPVNDKTVVDWIESQANLSYSFRALVKEYVREHGMTDATCMEVVPGGRKRGRPRNPVKFDPNDYSEVEQTSMDVEDVDTVEDEIETNDVADTTPEVPAKASVEKKADAKPVTTDDSGFVDPDEFF